MNKHYWQAYSKRLNEWWIQLSLKEQRTVAVGGTIVGLLLLYAVVWVPMQSHLESMRKQIKWQQKNIAWMQRVDQEMQQYKGHAQRESKSLTPLMLLSLLQKQIKQYGLEANLTELKQTESDSVEVHFQKIEFDKLITMLTALVKAHKIDIIQMNASAESTPGVVNADMILKSE